MSADIWQPTMHLRFARNGQLQQSWTRELREWRAYGGKEMLTRRYETEWRDVPTEVTEG